MVIVNKYLVPKGFTGITLYPFIFVRDDKSANDEKLINHERIHLAQQKELWLVGFYLRYLWEFLRNLIKYKDRNKAYHLISFEREAYYNENNLNYLSTRKKYAYKVHI